MTLRPADVIIGERQRSELGDLSELVQSIRTVGLLHPIVVDGEHRLIAGGRRLAAWQRVHEDQPIPAHVVEVDDPVQAELDENTVRLDLPPSDRVAVARRIEELARTREPAPRVKGGTPTGERQARMAASIAARNVGWSVPTYQRAALVIDLAEGRAVEHAGKGDRYYFEHPSPALRRVAREAREVMDRTGHVDPAYKAVVRGANGERPSPPADPLRRPRHFTAWHRGPKMWFDLWTMLNHFEDIQDTDPAIVAKSVPDEYRDIARETMRDALSYLLDVSNCLDHEDLAAQDQVAPPAP